MKTGTFAEYFELNQQKKEIEKKLKALKEVITAEFEKKDKVSIKQGPFRAIYELMNREILDQSALKESLGLDKYNGFKKAAPYKKLSIVKEA